MRVKKRTKSSRFRGSKTHARGFKKKARGSGHQGGVGMAGTGKRGDQKKTLVLNLYGNDYFGKDRAIRRKQAPKLKIITLSTIERNLSSLIKKGMAKEEKGSYVLTLKGFKILGNDDINTKLNVKVSAVSETAEEKIVSAGGSVEVLKSEKSSVSKKEDSKA